ncbi:MAG: hypothetical protein GY870_17740 [archaeon]|nr:hypothetical protein [archaeon]
MVTKERDEQGDNTKEHVLHTRIDSRTLKLLDNYVETYDVSYSVILRKAIGYYLKYAQLDNMNTSYLPPMILVPKEEFSFILNSLSDQEIEILAEQSYSMTKEGISRYFQKTGEKYDIENVTLRALLSMIRNNVFNYDGQNWFNKVSYNIKKKSFTIAGTHGFNERFSLYMNFFIKKLVKPYKYEIVKAALKEKMINLEFEKK